MDMRQRYAGYELDPQSDVVRLASDAFAGLANGGSSTLLRTGGGSDANELNERGVTSCVLGIGAEGCHSVHERISISELELLSHWALEIVREAARG